MRIFLIRHGESQGNVDRNVHKTTADHVIPLSERGIGQAQRCGAWLQRYFPSPPEYLQASFASHLTPGEREALPPLIRGGKPFLWNSPYRRARQTADHIEDMLSPILRGRKEHVLLGEQQFGLFDGLSDEECAERFPLRNYHYMKTMKASGKFWAPMPLGESRFNVAVRVHQAFGTFHRDAEKHGIKNLIVVAHGTTIRCFVMMWLHKPYEWIEREPIPKNCSVRLIEDGEDKGYIFPGFDREPQST